MTPQGKSQISRLTKDLSELTCTDSHGSAKPADHPAFAV